MRIEFTAKTNKDYLMVNEAIFHLKTGGTLTLDRESTEYTIEDGNLSMEWFNIYLWAINDIAIFINEPTAFVNESIANLLEGSWVELILEDDADEDYAIWNVEYRIIRPDKIISGGEKPISNFEKEMMNVFLKKAYA